MARKPEPLNLKWLGWPDGPVNLGYIGTDNRLGTDAVNWKVGADRARSYIDEVSAIIGGAVRGEGSATCVVAADGKRPQIESLLPQHADAWALAMQRFIEKLKSDPEIES